MRGRLKILGLGALLILGLTTIATAAPIYVINSGVSGHPMVTRAVNDLNALGHTVSTGATLGDYSAFDQVWDLRYNGNLVGADVTAMGNYLASGGRMYLTGEWSFFDGSRNNSLASWVNGVGGGTLTPFVGDFSLGTPGAQVFTPTGQALLNNNPNALAQIYYTASRTLSNTGTGFLITELRDNPGVGSLIGWDFGDIAGAPDARMLVGFDIEIFQALNGQGWTENMYTYLAAVPEPSTMFLLGAGLIALAGWSRRRR